MSPKVTHIACDYSVAFCYVPWGLTMRFVDTRAVRLTWIAIKGRPVACRLRVTASPEAFGEVEAAQAFHLTPEVRGPTFGGELVGGHDVELDLQLDPSLLEALAMPSDDPAGAARRIENELGQPGSRLAAEASWYLLSAVQGTDALKVGFRTAWADELAPPRDTLTTLDEGA